MEFLPKSLGTRPRLAVEVRTEGLVAARAEDANAILSAAARVELAAGTVVPSLKQGNIVDRAGVVAGLRKVLEGVSGRGSGRETSRFMTLIVPDASVRVLLLDFDELPGSVADALPVVRFRLKKLLPFDADDAAVSYQVMASAKGSIQVLAIAMPREVLQEYENVVRAVDYVPGAVLPSTLAVLSGLEPADSAALVVNACTTTMTTAILKAGVLLLHRSVELQGGEFGAAARIDLGQAVIGRDLSHKYEEAGHLHAASVIESAMLRREAEMRGVLQGPGAAVTNPAGSTDLAQAISVAAAYFEDTLRVPPQELMAAGVLSAARMSSLLVAEGFEGLRVREVMEAEAIEAAAVSSRVSTGWLAGVRGALKN